VSTTTQSASFADVARALRDQLVAVTGLDRGYVNFTKEEKWPTSSAEKAVFIRVFGIQPMPDAGAGRRARPLHRRVRVYMLTRNSLDYVGDEDEALWGDQGHDALELAVIDALDEFVPTKLVDGVETALVLEPVHPVAAEGGPPVGDSESEVGVTRSFLDFEAVYLAPVSNPAP
jgi:hypothetical protein